MPLIRVFFAISFSREIQDTLCDVTQQLKKHLPPNHIRWSQPDDFHITLQFLKALDENDIPQLNTSVRNQLKLFPPFFLELGELELFPTPAHPRVISIKVSPEASLAELSHRVGISITHTHYPIKKRPFRAHLTLGHIREQASQTLSFKDITLPTFPKIPVREITLYQSIPAKSGAHYQPLAHFHLRGDST